MFGNLAKYRKFKDMSKNFHQIEVTREEFVNLMISDGNTPEEADKQATITSALGSSVMIGDKMVCIAEKP